MQKLPWRHVHFTGIGGVGMTGLALILRDFDVAVTGSDMEDSENVELLRRRGSDVKIGHERSHVLPCDLLVYSSAVPTENPERQRARELGIEECRRGCFLAHLGKHFPTTVSCAGSHGKTTTSAMLAHILIECGLNPGYLVGGKVDGRDTPAGAGAGQVLVTEVDESDATQAQMESTYAIVTNVEDDHCWSVGGVEALMDCFREFGAKAKSVVCWDSARTRELYGDHPDVTFMGEADLRPLELIPAGRHNQINANLAIAVATRIGVAEQDAANAMRSFLGVDRRLSVRYQSRGLAVIEDYAHHPTEVKVTIAALRQRFPGHHLVVVFQPHRFERVLRYGAAFSRELALADEVIVTPPFAAWIDDADKADPRSIAENIEAIPARYEEKPYPKIAEDLAAGASKNTVIAVFGAGTITKIIEPLVAAVELKN